MSRVPLQIGGKVTVTVRDEGHRGRCTTVAMTREQKLVVDHMMRHNEYDATGPKIDVQSDDVVIGSLALFAWFLVTL